LKSKEAGNYLANRTNGQLSFDYRLREAICQSFNASGLMRMMGIEVE
jgi:hypothetical protein